MARPAEVEKALDLLKDKELPKSAKEPPVHKILWGLGIAIPPPILASFWANALLFGTLFGVLWAFGMWLLVWRNGSFTSIFLAGLMAGVLFGPSIALMMRSKRIKLGLPLWGEIKDQ